MLPLIILSQDLELRRELEEYTKRFGNLQQKMGADPRA